MARADCRVADKARLCAEDDESVIHPHQLLRTVAEETPEDTIIATDVGQHQLWSAQYNGRKHVRQFLTSGGWVRWASATARHSARRWPSRTERLSTSRATARST